MQSDLCCRLRINPILPHASSAPASRASHVIVSDNATFIFHLVDRLDLATIELEPHSGAAAILRNELDARILKRGLDGGSSLRGYVSALLLEIDNR